MIDDVSLTKKKNVFFTFMNNIFFFRQYQIIFFILFICNHIERLQSEHSETNNCPHLFKTLSDCTCVHSNTINCSYSRTITHLPRSWRSTNNNLTSFTQSIIRFDLIHTPSITSIKTDDFHVNILFFLSNH